jgi:hypothetical protein
MPIKIGAGGKPQPYEKSDGRYTDGVTTSQDILTVYKIFFTIKK